MPNPYKPPSETETGRESQPDTFIDQLLLLFEPVLTEPITAFTTAMLLIGIAMSLGFAVLVWFL